jgi:hypothetical protein
MTSRNQHREVISVSIAVQRTGLSRRVVLECVERQWVVEPFTYEDLVELRRIRRLRELGVNMPGIEIILHMRRRIEQLQSEVSRLERASVWFDEPESDELWQRRLPWHAREG